MHTWITFALACSAGFETADEHPQKGDRDDDSASGQGGESDGGGDSGEAEADWNVPETGDPIGTSFAGMAWTVTFSEMEISDPPNGGLLLDSLIEEQGLIFYADWASSDVFGLLVSLNDGGAQDLCNAPQPLPTADFSDNPLFLIDESNMVITSTDTPVTIRKARMMGVFSQDATSWTWAALRATIDTREFAEDLEATGIDACEMLESFGTSCVPCEDGEEVCMRLIVDEMVGEPFTGTFDPDAGDCR